MKAVIMAGGEGKRLRPITCTMPKPMVPLLNKPVIDYCIELLKCHGVEDIVATLHYLPNVITTHCGDGGRYGVKLSYSVEKKPLGTAGSVRKAMGEMPESVIVISGDAITDLDITAALNAHREKNAPVTIVLKQVEVPTEYGVALTDREGRIYRFIEKPMISEVFSDLANTGIYIIEPEIIKQIPTGRVFDFSKNLFPQLLKDGIPIYGYITDKYWCDIGDIAQYRAAQRDMLMGRCEFDTVAERHGDAWVEPGALISEEATLTGCCYVGSGAEIGNAIISDGTVIGSGARVGDYSSAKRTVIMQNVRVRENAELRGTILCEGAEVESGASLFNDTVIGCGGRVGKNSTVSNGASVWPDGKVLAGQCCRDNLKWDDAWEPFNGKAAGYTDTVLTPEYAARAGGAFAACMGSLPAEAAVATDGSQQGVMLKHGMISGLVAQGIDVADMGYCSRSAFEHGIREFGYRGGIYISCCTVPHRAELVMYDETGTELADNAFRTYEQELRTGAKKPLTSERLGIIQRVNGVSRAYEAHLNRIADLSKNGGDGFSVLIGGRPDIYDGVARVLLPRGYDVKYFSGSRQKLNGALDAAGQGVGFYGDDETFIAAAWGGIITEDRLTVALAMAAAEDKKTELLVMPSAIPDEYIRMISDMGAKIVLASSKRSRWARTALEKKAYLPELFEPEVKIIRLTELAHSGRLKKHLDMMPCVKKAESIVKCGWKDVGRILRSFMNGEEQANVELIDGVKVKVDRGWILVRPNETRTACRVITGSMDAEYSRELADIYGEKLRCIAEKKNVKE